MVGSMGVYEFLRMRVVQCSSNVPASHAELLGGAEPHIHPDILGRHDHLLQDRGGTPGVPLRRVGAIDGARFEIEAVQM